MPNDVYWVSSYQDIREYLVQCTIAIYFYLCYNGKYQISEKSHSHFGNGVRNGVIKQTIYVLLYRLWTNITWRFLLKSSKIYRRSRWQWKNIGETEINIIIVATINWKTLSSFLMRPKITFLVAYRKVKRAPQYCSWQLWFGLVWF